MELLISLSNTMSKLLVILFLIKLYARYSIFKVFILSIILFKGLVTWPTYCHLPLFSNAISSHKFLLWSSKCSFKKLLLNLSLSIVIKTYISKLKNKFSYCIFIKFMESYGIYFKLFLKFVANTFSLWLYNCLYY